MRIEVLEGNIRALWLKACKYDKIDPKSTFVQFSKSNPYTAAYDQMMNRLQTIKGAK